MSNQGVLVREGPGPSRWSMSSDSYRRMLPLQKRPSTARRSEYVMQTAQAVDENLMPLDFPVSTTMCPGCLPERCLHLSCPWQQIQARGSMNTT